MDHAWSESAVHVRVGQQQGDRLVAHDRAKKLLGGVRPLKVDGHREHDYVLRVVERPEHLIQGVILRQEIHMHSRADLSETLLDERAHTMAEWPRICGGFATSGQQVESRARAQSTVSCERCVRIEHIPTHERGRGGSTATAQARASEQTPHSCRL
eukprot:3527103-Prymnesium_polylepis.1